jgi:hypothetical protein
MIRLATALRFDREAENGRTEPLRISVSTDDGVEQDVVMKIAEGVTVSIEGLANEMLGSLLAADLGLPVNEPFFVTLDDDFVQAVSEPTVRKRLASACKVGFASRDAGRQWRRWITSDSVAASQTQTALAAFAFDAFIANNDRSPKNPNLLVRDIDWRLIDHEAAFSFRMKIAPRCRPWEAGNLNLLRKAGADSEHVFASHLAGRKGLDFNDIATKWADLSDARVAQYGAMLPDEWDTVRPQIDEAIDHLKLVRDKIDLCIAELKRVLL